MFVGKKETFSLHFFFKSHILKAPEHINLNLYMLFVCFVDIEIHEANL